MKTLMITILMIFSTSLFANNYETNTNTTTIKSTPTTSSTSAYKVGHDMLSSLSNKSQSELQKALNIHGVMIYSNSLSIDNSYVTVDESANSSGDISYTANVNVKYSYKAKDRD